MTTTIAVAGKGGTGKTTLAGLLIRRLAEAKTGPILAIDADPASNLNTSSTCRSRRPWATSARTPPRRRAPTCSRRASPSGTCSTTRSTPASSKASASTCWPWARPEGPGCYCAANNMLRAIIDAIAGSYPWVVIDNEAGLEHLSRRTTRDVDVLLMVSDATVRGVTTAGRIVALARRARDQGRRPLPHRQPSRRRDSRRSSRRRSPTTASTCSPCCPTTRGRRLRRRRPGPRRPARRQSPAAPCRTSSTPCWPRVS